MTYGEAWMKANALLFQGNSVCIVVSRIDGFYVATSADQIAGGEVVQYVASGPYQTVNLAMLQCVGSA